MATLVQPNALDAAAVDARQEIDLRVGASFTRFQTLLLQEKFDWAAAGLEKPIISYGPCQFPTLGIIVQRAWCGGDRLAGRWIGRMHMGGFGSGGVWGLKRLDVNPRAPRDV